MKKFFANLEKFTLIFLPFSVIFSVFFKYKLDINYLAYAKEALVSMILILSILNFKKFKFNKLTTYALGFVLYSLLSILFHERINFNFIFQVLKSEVFYMVVFLCAILRTNKLDIKYFMRSFEIMLLIGILIYVIDPSIFVYFGFRDDFSTFYINQAPAFCQRIEASTLCRFQGLLEGPNKMGLLLSFYTFLNIRFYKKFNFFLLLSIISLIFTFSRSSILALIFGLIFIFDYSKLIKIIRNNKYKLISLMILVLALLLQHLELFLKPASSSEHLSKAIYGLEIYLQNPIFGQGLGFAGPASRFLGNELIVESHLISILINTGLVGFILFMGFYIEVLKAFYKENKHLFGFFLGLLIPLNLLHSFESFVVSFFVMWISASFIDLKTYQEQK